MSFRKEKLPQENSSLIHQLNASIALKETIANVEAYLGIGVANKRWAPLIFMDHNNASRILKYWSAGVENLGATDYYAMWGCDLPTVINGKNLVITKTRIGVQDADAGDYVNVQRWYGATIADPPVVSNFLEDGTNITAADLYEYDHADTTIGGVYSFIYYAVNCQVTNAGDLNISHVEVEYYYA